LVIKELQPIIFIDSSAFFFLFLKQKQQFFRKSEPFGERVVGEVGLGGGPGFQRMNLWSAWLFCFEV
jgi:hypothetical protein